MTPTPTTGPTGPERPDSASTMTPAGTDDHSGLYAQWREACASAAGLAEEAARLRAHLEERIGLRGLVLGTINLPNGRTAPLYVENEQDLRKLWRRLPATLKGERPDVTIAIRAANQIWDAAAAPAGYQDALLRARHAQCAADVLLHRLRFGSPGVPDATAGQS